MTPYAKYWQRNNKMLTQGCLQKCKISVKIFGVIDCHHGVTVTVPRGLECTSYALWRFYTQFWVLLSFKSEVSINMLVIWSHSNFCSHRQPHIQRTNLRICTEMWSDVCKCKFLTIFRLNRVETDSNIPRWLGGGLGTSLDVLRYSLKIHKNFIYP